MAQQDDQASSSREIHEVWNKFNETNREMSDLRAGQSELRAELGGVGRSVADLGQTLRDFINRPAPKAEKPDIRGWMAVILASLVGGFGLLAFIFNMAVTNLKEEDTQQKSEIGAFHGILAAQAKAMKYHTDAQHAEDIQLAETRGEYKQLIAGLQKQIDGASKQADHMDRLHHLQDLQIKTNEKAAERHDAYFKAISAWDTSLKELGLKQK